MAFLLSLFESDVLSNGFNHVPQRKISPSPPLPVPPSSSSSRRIPRRHSHDGLASTLSRLIQQQQQNIHILIKQQRGQKEIEEEVRERKEEEKGQGKGQETRASRGDIVSMDPIGLLSSTLSSPSPSPSPSFSKPSPSPPTPLTPADISTLRLSRLSVKINHFLSSSSPCPPSSAAPPPFSSVTETNQTKPRTRRAYSDPFLSASLLETIQYFPSNPPPYPLSSSPLQVHTSEASMSPLQPNRVSSNRRLTSLDHTAHLPPSPSIHIPLSQVEEKENPLSSPSVLDIPSVVSPSLEEKDGSEGDVSPPHRRHHSMRKSHRKKNSSLSTEHDGSVEMGQRRRIGHRGGRESGSMNDGGEEQPRDKEKSLNSILGNSKRTGREEKEYIEHSHNSHYGGGGNNNKENNNNNIILMNPVPSVVEEVYVGDDDEYTDDEDFSSDEGDSVLYEGEEEEGVGRETNENRDRSSIEGRKESAQKSNKYVDVSRSRMSADGRDNEGDIGTSHSNDNKDGGTEDPSAVSASLPPPPSSFLRSLISTAFNSVFLSNIYITFTLAILFQSFIQKRGILPKDWQTELRGTYWLLALVYFVILFSFPFILIEVILNSNGLYQSDGVNVSSTAPFTAGLFIYIALFIIIHCLTIYYAYIRPDLKVIHSSSRLFKWSFIHVLSLLSLLFEGAQLISPFLSREMLGLKGSPSPSTNNSWYRGLQQFLQVSLLQFTGVSFFIISFWSVFGLIVIYALLLGYGIHSNMQPDHSIAPLIFSFIPGTLFITCLSTLFSVFRCTIVPVPSAGSGSGSGTVGDSYSTLFDDPTDGGMVCWSTAAHRAMCLAALMALLYYSSSAMFVACYRGDAGGSSPIKFKPLFLVIERTLRGLFAISSTLLTSNIASRLLSALVLIPLLGAAYYLTPCNIKILNRLKIFSYFLPLHMLLLSFLPELFRKYTQFFDDYILLFIGFGWLIGFIVFVGNEIRLSAGRGKRKKKRGGKKKTGGSADGTQIEKKEGEREDQMASTTSEITAIVVVKGE